MRESADRLAPGAPGFPPARQGRMARRLLLALTVMLAALVAAEMAARAFAEDRDLGLDVHAGLKRALLFTALADSRIARLHADDALRVLAGAHLLGCGDGPASFNAELTAAGGSVVSIDPLYAFDAAAIGRRVDEVFDTMMAQTLDNLDEFVWGPVVADPDHLARLRRGAMDRFLADYPAGRAEGRYVEGELPTLPFADGEFDVLALQCAGQPRDRNRRRVGGEQRVGVERPGPRREGGSHRRERTGIGRRRLQ